MPARRTLSLGLWATAVALAATLAGTSVAAAVPPPPPNPSDSEIDQGKADAERRAGDVGRLTNQLAEAEAALMGLQADVEAKLEDANKALVDLRAAEDSARRARDDADAARRESDGAGQAIDDARAQLDAFAAGSFKQGSTVGSITAYIGAKSPEDLLARVQMLNAISGSELDTMQELERARLRKANLDSRARAALEVANRRQSEAEEAKHAADVATELARQAQREQQGRAEQLRVTRTDYERQLEEAQSKVGGLQDQRQRYEKWLADKRREDEENAKKAAAGGAHPTSSGSASERARTVIDRAISQLGVEYAWGGGNGRGPTRGIRDGGVADSYGDFSKIGFDCSGLMIYAFAGVGVDLPHYSGYQADAGRRVPLSAMAPGDLLFWSTSGRIHHVALYIGNDQMVEAPYSGSVVRIAPVRYGGIVSYATRVL
ncbi:NlpC/P60 family protein [Actinokineospora auranticolor]|uniref:NlpC/P60 family protein n=1 Tax=Actinokineospora auranticolor TaxID=155976 RepID=A0A2S6GP06_9PSEU|nr:NlpC/P60 family protein [Actinokineospora auranticolor]PPK66893.1 NlpC/P60 family protein [Actinokineospora auranticolor]